MDIDVNGPRLGELLGFPDTHSWSSIRRMMEVVGICRGLYAAGEPYECVDAYWRAAFAVDKRDRKTT